MIWPSNKAIPMLKHLDIWVFFTSQNTTKNRFSNHCHESAAGGSFDKTADRNIDYWFITNSSPYLHSRI